MDTTNTREISKSVRGLDRMITIDCTSNPPHPSRGETRGYPTSQRNRAMNNIYRHHDYKLVADQIGCSPYTVRRWENVIFSYKMTGGRQKDKLTGTDEILL